MIVELLYIGGFIFVPISIMSMDNGIVDRFAFKAIKAIANLYN